MVTFWSFVFRVARGNQEGAAWNRMVNALPRLVIAAPASGQGRHNLNEGSHSGLHGQGKKEPARAGIFLQSGLSYQRF